LFYMQKTAYEIVRRLEFRRVRFRSRHPKEQLTSRMLNAIESPHVAAIGHPTGRRLGRREPYPLHVERVLERAAATGTFMEINGQIGRASCRERVQTTDRAVARQIES